MTEMHFRGPADIPVLYALPCRSPERTRGIDNGCGSR